VHFNKKPATTAMIRFTLIFGSIILLSSNLQGQELAVCGDEVSRNTLLDMKQRDQKIRREQLAGLRENGWTFEQPEMIALTQIMADIDAKNQAILDNIITLCGWPSYDVFGYDAGRAAELVALHAATRNKYFPYIEAAFKKKTISGEMVALFVDKILIDEGKSQRYGTQVNMLTKEFAPIEQPSELNSRRLAIGLDSLPDFPLPTREHPPQKKKSKPESTMR
jgi:hypothetical protein